MVTIMRIKFLHRIIPFSSFFLLSFSPGFATQAVSNKNDAAQSFPSSNLGSLLAQSPPCPNIAGAFQRPSDNLIIYWEQDGCNISSDAPFKGFDHTLKGRWVGSHFDVTTTRRNINNGCTTLMYGRIYMLGDSRFRAEVYGTDGRCDLLPNYTEESVWTRR